MQWIDKCAAAFRFLTIIPLPSQRGTTPEDLDGSTFFFPLVGLVLGLAAALAAFFFWQIFPAGIAATLLIILLFSFSGALHLDGFADTADGFFSSRPREKILEIMRDSRIGVMGVVALCSIFLLKYSSLAALGKTDAVKAAFLAPVAGRCAMVIMMAILPYVRPEGGLGTRFYSGKPRWPALLGFVFLSASCFILYGIQGLTVDVFVLMVLLLFCFQCYRVIGGTTGDTLGAACEISEASVVLICTAQYWF